MLGEMTRSSLRVRDRLVLSAAAVLVTGVAGAAAQAAIVVQATDDQEIEQAGNFTPNPPVMRVGANDANSNDRQVILSFELPALSADIQTADLTITLEGVDTSGSGWDSADLYGLGVEASGSVDDYITNNGKPFYEGSAVDPNPNATLIMDSFLTKFGPRGADQPFPKPISTDDAADATLAAYLQSLYDNGAQAGDFAFFRINQSFNAFGNTRGWDIRGTTDGNPNAPVLTITEVPEPGSMALAGLGLLAIAQRRRTR